MLREKVAANLRAIVPEALGHFHLAVERCMKTRLRWKI
jgi:hypothetical protein